VQRPKNPSVGTVALRKPDEGFTLVEMVVALMILAIVLTALAPAFYGSLRATALTSERSVANGLAVAANEQMRSFPYYVVGYYRASGGTPTDVPSQCGGSNPVTLSAAGPIDGLPAFELVGQHRYNITRCVYWQTSSTDSTTSSSYNGAYKQTVVTVGWSFNGTTYSVTQTSAVYPGGQSSYAQSGAYSNHAPPGTTPPPVTTPPSPPQSVTVSSSTSTSVTLSVTAPASTPTPVDHYEIDFTNSYSGAGPVDCSACVWTYTTTTNSAPPVSGLSPGTTYWFQVRSIAVDGTPSSPTTPISGTTATGGSSGCTVYGLYVNPTQGVVDPNGHLVNASSFSLWVDASSPCNTQQLQVSYVSSGSATFASLTEQSSGAFTGSVGTGSTVWSVGNHQFTVYIGTNPASPLTQVQVDICQENGTTGRCSF
jgi:prepilin-type N-terminal cleavage/methylation domain-containing protein